MMNPDQILDFYNALKEMHAEYDDQINQPSVITTRLKSYQLKAVKWMEDREKNNNLVKNDLSEFRGGILADSIGLGKTLEMLCFIVANRAPPEFRAIFPTPKIKNCITYLNKNILDREPMHVTTKLSTEMQNHIKQNQSNCITFVYGQDNSLNCLNCYCWSTLEYDNKLIVVCALCGEAQHMECVNFKPKPFQDNLYLCPSCWYLSNKIDCKATLIIVPLPIMDQWVDEIEKHGLNVLKVHIYRGVHSGEYIEPIAFCEYDIVITTYSFLEDDLSSMSTTFPNSINRFKRVHNCPLFCLNWWRICLDYDINHLSNSTFKTILKLNCVNKWIMTGTPIQNSLDDLELPLKLLNIKKYCIRNDCYTIPSQIIDLQWLWFSYVMWRNSATDVNSELILQKSSIEYNWLTFPQIEKYYYTLQQEYSGDQFYKLIYKASLETETTIMESDYMKYDMNIVLTPMMTLRQSCLHPINRYGEFMKLIKTMSMKNIMNRLVENSGIDCNKTLTVIISHHTKIAGLYVKKKQIPSAINEYKIILDLIQKHEKLNLKVDACQKMSTMYNLDCLLHKTKIPIKDMCGSNGLKNLKMEMEKYETNHLDIHKNNVKMVFKMVQFCSGEISALIGNTKLIYSEWWPEMSFIVTLDEFLAQAKPKWEEYRSTGVADIGNSFSSMMDIDVQLKIWCMNLQGSKEDILETVDLLKNTPIDKLAREAMNCHLGVQRNFHFPKPECTICKAKYTLNTYKTILFSFPTNQNTFDELLKSKNNDEEEWKMSLHAFLLTVFSECIQANLKNKNVYKNAVVFLKIVELSRQEFIYILQFWSCVNDYISTYFEINLKAKSASFGDANSSENIPLMYESTEDEECEKEIFETIIKYKMKLLESKIVIDQNALKRDYAVFRYLSNFKKEEENSNVNKSCKICTLENDSIWAVLRCGHKICKPCLLTLLKSFNYSIIICPICRNYALAHTLYFGKVEIEEPGITLKGTFSIKIESITLKLMELIVQDPTVKVLIFSTWEKPLELLGKALKDNSVNHRILKLGNEYKKTLKAFKTNMKIKALLMTMSLGSKGLNLTEASRIFFMEPIVENTDVLEAIGRINRIGQTKPTFVHHFIIKDSIEEIITNELSHLRNLSDITITQMLNLFKN
ncbi:Zinc finger, PHD-type,Zinc finger, RING-type,Zinc finger, RING/FYVE/PHD-type,Helicase, C- [Cinara cedri]|uniref:Zinc finger, PHD-type,Zinc finger, RING-type,Zinc finger, RING/FYVE/PHD-type,Helicase, C n=1 Tax=Cinara cedri TaxID=506608 RepID=A0A5E4MV33_9HEMI|nr:Zinc finger, PHD-type,Zinc finger, RING-type,Zinc finger, RING/FYVE/PHD-type,Helicase, C- [Cinara cedri]